MPVHIIFLTDEPGIMAIRMLLFELLPPFPLLNDIPRVIIPVKGKELGGIETVTDKEVMRFYAEFVDIDEITKRIYNKTLAMQKYFNHGNTSVVFGGDNTEPGSVTYFEVPITYKYTFSFKTILLYCSIVIQINVLFASTCL